MENTALHMPAKNAEGLNGKIRIDHVGLRTLDFEGTITWYVEKLGFREIKRYAVGALHLAFLAPANDDTFWLEILSGGETVPAPAAGKPVAAGFQHLCLAVENVDETLATLRERGVKVTREAFDVPIIGKRCGFIADLYGNALELMQNLG